MLFDEYGEYNLNNPAQRAYVQNLYQLTDKVIEVTEIISKKVRNVRFQKKFIDEMVGKYYSALRDIASYLPVSENLPQFDSLSQEQKDLILHLDTGGMTSLYITNRLFAPEFVTDRYQLKQDVDIFNVEYGQILSREGISLNLRQFRPIETHDDFLQFVIIPLVLNVVDHAFNPENDAYGRLNEVKFKKYIHLSGYPENEELENGYYTIRVEDNGFGIRDEVLPHIFEKGFTTKSDDKTEHGIGLWVIKDFVERQAGRIDVETTLGKRTEFRIEIPYDGKIGPRYKQAEIVSS